MGKAFFGAGFLSQLEKMLEEKMSSTSKGMQARCRWKLARMELVKKLKIRESAKIIQRNVRAFWEVKNWSWMKMLYKLKPLLASADAAKDMAELEEELDA